MEQELKENLKAIGEAFALATGLASGTIWNRAAKDARFLERIEAGKGFTIKTYDNAMAWFSANWPSESNRPSMLTAFGEAENSGDLVSHSFPAPTD